jgi:hypothetical protein
LTEREEELRAAEAALNSAREEVRAAHQLDVDAIVEAREAGKPDPPPAHEPEAERQVAEAENAVEILRARVARLRAEYARTIEEQRPAWATRLERKWRETDQKLRRHVEELDAQLEAQRELRAAWRYVDATLHGEDAEHVLRKAMAAASQGSIDLSDVLAGLEAGAADRVVGQVTRERQDRIEREDAERLAFEERVAEARRAAGKPA